MRKSELISELAERAGISQRRANRVLDELAQIAYREAANGFILPGLCKLEVVRHKAKRCRNPVTGQTLMIAERDVVKAKPLKKAKDIITPRRAGAVTVVEEDAGWPAEPASTASEQEARQPTSASDIEFACPGCGTLMVTEAAYVGCNATCPTCSRTFIIPAASGDGGTRVAQSAPATPQPEGGSAVAADEFVLFACSDCGQQIEAPGSMAGTVAECPSCGMTLDIPRQSTEGIARAPVPGSADELLPDLRSRMSQTIRIDLDEDLLSSS